MILAAVLVFPYSAFAQEAAPPLPPPRPKGLTPQVQERAQEQVNEQVNEQAQERKGPPKPDPQAGQETRKGQETQKEQEPQDGKAASPSEDDLACIGRLEALGLKFGKRPPVEEANCRIGNPVSVMALPNGVDVAPDSLMECRYAETLAHWVGDVVGPRAKEQFQSAPTKLLIGTSYQCRDQRSGGKRSEHAFGNGVDVMGFEFDKRPPLTITFQPGGSPEDAFQSAIHKGACEIFKTVLGPGADADHGNHLHLDMRARKNDYRICQ